MFTLLDILKIIVNNNFEMEDMYMKKLVKVVLSLAAFVAFLGGIWMVLSKFFGEDEYEDDYDEYYMEEDDGPVAIRSSIIIPNLHCAMSQVLIGRKNSSTH